MYWLRIIRDHTDAAILPQDIGITKDAVPPGEWGRMIREGSVSLVKGRLVVTGRGRKQLTEVEDAAKH